MSRTVSAALQTHFDGDYHTLATCWHATLINGSTFGFTDHDRDIVFQGVTYEAAAGYTASDVATTGQLNVDNLEIDGMLQSPSITEDDLRAGLWDHARIRVFMVNWRDLTMGSLKQRVGHLGEVSIERGVFKAEQRGLMQAYTTTLVELFSPGCRARFGDARCKFDLSTVTVMGSVFDVSSDGLVIYDPNRTEPGPTGSEAIVSISQANPGVVTTYQDMSLAPGQPVTISGVTGMTAVNGTTVARNPVGNTFELSVDTTLYPAYAGGGIVTPLGGGSGYFDYGLFTMTSGLNAGLSMEIKSYVPGQFTLQLPFPYPIAGVGESPSETYTAIAGCDKAFATCRDRFNNILNFRGEPYLPGIDRIIQVGKQ